jgi:uncharacterized surface protein with fasciclin (FAS1) repeats
VSDNPDGDVNITITDVEAASGIIHAIDAVVLRHPT